jgi:hypothetical protein
MKTFARWKTASLLLGIGTLIVVAPANFAMDDQFTTARLYDECTNYSPPSVQRAHCNGFVHGFLIGALTGWGIAAEVRISHGPHSSAGETRR